MGDEVQTSTNPDKCSRNVAVYIVIAVSIYVIIESFYVFSPILLSIILIFLITLAANPSINRLKAYTGGRKRATGLAIAAVFTLGALLGWATVVPLKQSISIFSEKLPAYWERLQKPLIKMEQQAVLTEEKLQEEVEAEISRESPDAISSTASKKPADGTRHSLPNPASSQSNTTNGESSLRSSLVGLMQNVFGQIKGVAQNTTDMLIVLTTVLVGVIFSLMNPRPLFAGIFISLPEQHHFKALAIIVRVAEFVPRWAGSVLISMATIGSLFFLFMWPIFGFTDAIMLGLLATLLSAIPFLGPILTLIPALLLAFGQGGFTPLWVILAYSVVQALESNVILPLVMSRGMNVHPVAVIISMLLSIAAFGVLGAIIAAPLVAIVTIVHEEIFRKRFLPSVSDNDLDALARRALRETTDQ